MLNSNIKKDCRLVDTNNYSKHEFNGSVLITTARGNILLYTGVTPCEDEMPVVTAENYTKWYSLYIIDTNGDLYKFIPNAYEVGFRDDKFNPKELMKYCEDNDLYIDEVTLDAIVGRWEQEVLENYYIGG